MPATLEINDARAVLEELRSQGVSFWIEGEQLRVRAVEGVISAEMLEKMRAHKPQIMRLLLDAEHTQPVLPELRPRPRPEAVPIIRYHIDRWADMLANRSGARFACGTHFVVRTSIPLDIAMLTQSLQLLAARQSILTARVIDGGHGPCFVYDTRSPIVPTFIDLSATPGMTEERARQVATDLVWHPFDLAADAWFRAFVIRLGAADHVVGFVIHHFIADAQSVVIVAQELFAIYGALSSGRPHTLPLLPIQYHDYVLAINEWLDTDKARMHEAFWRQRLRGAPTTRIPPDADLQPDTVGREAIASFDLPDSLTEKLRLVTDCNSVRIHVHLAAALSATLAYVSGSADVLTFHRVSGRSHQTLLNLVGAFFDATALRVRIDWEQSFAQCVALTQQSFYESYANSLYPWAMLKRLLPQVGASGIAPLFNFIDSYSQPGSNTSGPRPSGQRFNLYPPALEMHLARNHPGFSLEIKHTVRGLAASLEYFESRYTVTTIDRFMDTFTRLLEAGLTYSSIPMHALLTRSQIGV